MGANIRAFRTFGGVATMLRAYLARGASYVGIGGRLQWSLLFTELEMLVGGGGDDDRSYSLDVGVGFF